MCATYHVLPDAGGLLDQHVDFWRMHAIIGAARDLENGDAAAPSGSGMTEEEIFLQSIPMVAL